MSSHFLVNFYILNPLRSLRLCVSELFKLEKVPQLSQSLAPPEQRKTNI